MMNEYEYYEAMMEVDDLLSQGYTPKELCEKYCPYRFICEAQQLHEDCSAVEHE